jgi:hypothetical protein
LDAGDLLPTQAQAFAGNHSLAVVARFFDRNGLGSGRLFGSWLGSRRDLKHDLNRNRLGSGRLHGSRLDYRLGLRRHFGRYLYRNRLGSGRLFGNRLDHRLGFR